MNEGRNQNLEKKLYQFVCHYYNPNRLPEYIDGPKFIEEMKDMAFDIIMEIIERQYLANAEISRDYVIEIERMNKILFPFCAKRDNVEVRDIEKENWRIRNWLTKFDFKYDKEFIEPFIEYFRQEYFVDSLKDIMEENELFDVNVAILISEYVV